MKSYDNLEQEANYCYITDSSTFWYMNNWENKTKEEYITPPTNDELKPKT